MAGEGGDCQALLGRRGSHGTSRWGGWVRDGLRSLSLPTAPPLPCATASPCLPATQECTCMNSGEASTPGKSRGTVCGLCTCCPFHLMCPSSLSPTKAVTLPLGRLPCHLEPSQSTCALLLEAMWRGSGSGTSPSRGAASPRARLCHPCTPRAREEPVRGKNVAD